MVKFTNQQRLEIIKNYYRNSESVVAILRALTPIFGRNNRSTRQAVRAIVDHSIPRRSQELGIAQTTLWRIMRKDLGLHAFKIKLTQELKPLDLLKRRNFSNWALSKLEENEEFHRKIIFSDDCQRSGRNVCQSGGKLCPKNRPLYTASWWSYDRYRISFIKFNACTTPTINLNSISQIFLCFIHR